MLHACAAGEQPGAAARVPTLPGPHLAGMISVSAGGRRSAARTGWIGASGAAAPTITPRPRSRARGGRGLLDLAPRSAGTAAHRSA